MKIGFDVSLLSQDSRSGVGWYTWRTLQGASKYLSNDEIVVFGFVPYAKHKQLKKELSEFGFSQVALFSVPSRFFHPLARLWQQHDWPVIERFTKHLDVFHSFDWYSYPSYAPQSATLYDMTPLSHTDYHSFDNKVIFSRRLEIMRKRASAIFCISQATMATAAQYDSDIHDRCMLAYPGIDEPHIASYPSRMLRSKLSGISRFFLAVNMSGGRKNLPRLLSVYDTFFNDYSIPLVLAGTLSSDDRQLLKSSGRGIIAVGYVSETDLNWLYREALALVYPSIVEGFGLPVLETLAAGGIVVTSNKSSMAEVGGNAALYIDPTSDESIQRALRLIEAMSRREREQRITMGKKLSKQFSLASQMATMREVWSEMQEGRGS